MLARSLYNNTRYFTLCVIVIVAVGVASFTSIARQEDPTITNFVATVTTFFPGATPERVEALVTRPVEDELRKIAEVDDVHSYSSTDILIEVDGEFDSMARIRDVIVNTTASGSTTRLSDIATVYKAQATPPASMVLTQGKPGILIAVAMDEGLQVDVWSKSFNRFVDAFRARAPAACFHRDDHSGLYATGHPARCRG